LTYRAVKAVDTGVVKMRRRHLIGGKWMRSLKRILDRINGINRIVREV